MTSKNSHDNTWLSPFEAGRQWIEFATKAQTVLFDQIMRASAPSPFSQGAVATTFSEFLASVLTNPATSVKAQSDLWQRHATLWQDLMTKGFEVSDNAAGYKKDRRFKDEEWDRNLAFKLMKHNYLIGSDWLRMLIRDNPDLPAGKRKQLEFFTERFIDATSPTNFPLSNPTVLKKTAETGGFNLVKGFSRYLDDMAANAGHVRRAAEDAFELGVNLAPSKGSVIYRTDMMELIQYDPSTTQTFKTPLLLVPPWVNKFYMFDLQPKSSFIKWAVDQGFTVFVISWVNPCQEHAEKDFEDYWLDGPYIALDAIQKATGEKTANIISYCLGGTLTAAGLAHLAAQGESDRVSSATMIASMTDFEKFGDFEAFVTEEQVATLENYLKHKGFLSSADLTRLFALLRANDLIWSAGISSYLLAEDAVPSDLLFWFADGIGMPAKTLSTFLRKVILQNALTKSGAMKIGKTPIDLQSVSVPLCFVSLKDDHVCAWQDTYQGASQFRAEKKFILGGSGHNAGTISHPSAGKHGYWINQEFPSDPETWFKGSQRKDGSWWPEWATWLKERSGPEVPARVVGVGALPALEAAPGGYVKVRR